MRKSKNPILIRTVRSQFVRIIGLEPDEREKFAKRLRRYHRSESTNTALVISFETHGWLDVRESGILQNSPAKREKLTNEFKECVANLAKLCFPKKHSPSRSPE